MMKLSDGMEVVYKKGEKKPTVTFWEKQQDLRQ